MKSVIVHGPQGCGKSLQGEKLRKHFGLDLVQDEFEFLRNSEIRAEGVLYLSSYEPDGNSGVASRGLRVIAFEDAMREIGAGS